MIYILLRGITIREELVISLICMYVIFGLKSLMHLTDYAACMHLLLISEKKFLFSFCAGGVFADSFKRTGYSRHLM